MNVAAGSFVSLAHSRDLHLQQTKVDSPANLARHRMLGCDFLPSPKIHVPEQAQIESQFYGLPVLVSVRCCALLCAAVCCCVLVR